MKAVVRAVPMTGDRVCLAGWAAYTDRHDHGTVIALRPGPLDVKVLVAWDDDRGDEPTAWCDLTALDTRCPTRWTLTRPTSPKATR